MNDEKFVLTTAIDRPAPEVFAWHERPGALARLCPPWARIELLASSGGILDGARVDLRTHIGGWWTRWQVEHRDYIANQQFRDVLLNGPFAKWEHLHRVVSTGPNACTLTDEITYRLPGGFVGRWLAGDWVRTKLERLFAWRHATTKADVELASRYGVLLPKCVLIAGASGLIGRGLVPFLQTQGHVVRRLVRRTPRSDDEFQWNPAHGEIDDAALDGVDAIVNLSGENVGAGRWTARRREAILRSRVDATRTLVDGLRKAGRKPEVFVSASAVGYYGDTGSNAVDETAPIGHGFLPEICLAWETHAEGAARAEVRTVLVRMGVVLTPAGGALGKLRPLFRAGLGGRIGTGRQWMSWVGIDDAVGAIYHAIVEPKCNGPINVVSPQPVTNAEFSASLARILHRPAILPVPTFALRILFGQMADETILLSTCARSTALLATKYAFRHSTLEAALRSVLGR